MDKYSPFLSLSDLSSFFLDETTTSDKNALSAENSESNLSFNYSHYTRSNSLDNSCSIQSDSIFFESRKITRKQNASKLEVRNPFGILDSQIKPVDELAIHKSDTFSGKYLEKKEFNLIPCYIQNVPIINKSGNVTSSMPKYFSTPIHFSKSQTQDKNLENKISKEVVTNPRNTLIMPKRNMQMPKIANNSKLSYSKIKRENNLKYSTPNRYINFDPRVFYKSVPYHQKNYQTHFNELPRNIMKQQFFSARGFESDKTFQNQPNYSFANYQALYNQNLVNLSKFSNYIFTNWTNYLMANNLCQQNLFIPNIQSFLIPNRNFNSWFVS